jgi:hypothetical protein
MSCIRYHLLRRLCPKGCWRLVCPVQLFSSLHQMLGPNRHPKVGSPDGPTHKGPPSLYLVSGFHQTSVHEASPLKMVLTHVS